MNTSFSFKRIMHILHADYIEYDTYIIFYVVVLLVSYILLLPHISNNDIAIVQFFSFCVGLGGCRFAGNKVNNSKGTFLTLPASTVEKFFALLLECLLIFIAYSIVFLLAYFIAGMFAENPMFDFCAVYTIPLSWVSAGLFFLTLAFLANMTVHKLAILVVFVFCFLYFMGISEDGTLRGSLDSLSDISVWIIPALFVLSGLFLYLSYAQLKRLENR